ncbi:alanine/ornithine racemase family PLP-dependent enzyme [Halothermothrix orenii]|uniref:Alanine racemase domain protein n=1 Tax=Halothermothrix orenii (strain H 168 / OCM 544 / DSM 9562) TaxID=373903 RepID=B8CZE3_HALOH|nr:alanine/ornithine racemase family PLP-dependent enzyme [Halothermothrix orenii]ACL70662.1 alanine racemase domain protein [Halothermothrix orenii H 168]
MKTPRVNINLPRIRENASIFNRKCQQQGISLTGVVKVMAGDLKVIKTFVQAGLTSLGDSRLYNLKKIREAGIGVELMLLRLPRLDEVSDVIKYSDISLNSEVTVIEALSREAIKVNRSHDIIVMVDVGDLREGVLPEDISEFFGKIIDLPGINIKGLGTNVGCYGGVLPTYKNTNLLIELKEKMEVKYGVHLPVISGGNSATTYLLDRNELPSGVNNLRVGEGILRGVYPTFNEIIEGVNQNCITLTASIIEVKDKPSVPRGRIGRDAFGNKPRFEDRGIRRRAILAVGRQDVKISGLDPVLDGVEVIGASSDHLIVDITEARYDLSVGDELEFNLDYGGILRAMTSPYVYKNYIGD